MNKIKLLIVEDEGVVAMDLAQKLGRLGYEVAGTTARGDEAVALAGRLRPNLVLMDILLEGPLDGIAAAEAIGRDHDVPVIYLTAHSDPATLARAKLTGPFGYILKPFEERELATQIELAFYRHQADRQLREQREWLRVTLTSIGDAVISTDAEGRVTFVNPVAESLTGWKAEEASGQPVQRVFRIVNEQTGEPLEEPVARVLREGRAVELANHTALVTKDGRTVPIEDSAAPILDAAGQVIGAVLVFHDVTEKRRAEEELARAAEETQRQRDLLAVTLASIGDGVIVTDAQGRVTFLNGEAERLTGWASCEAEGHSLPDVFHIINEQTRQPVESPVEKVLRLGTVVGLANHTILIAKDGREIPIDDSGAPIRQSDGTVQGVVLVFRDFTEQKQAEETLRASEQRIQQALRVSHSFTFEWRTATDEVLRSASCERILGLAGEEARKDTGERYFQRVHPDDRARFTQMLRDLAPAAPSYTTEYRVLRGDDSVVVLEEAGQASFDAASKVERLVGVTTDITARKRAEEALRQSERRYKMLHESLRDAFVQVAMDGRIVEFNDLYCQMLGYTPEEVRTLTYQQITPERWHEAEAAIVREQIIARGYSNIYEKEYRRKDGTVFPVELRTILSHDEKGQPNAMWGIVRDITERRRAEDALARAARQRALLVELSARVVAQRSVDELLATVVDAARELTEARLSVSGHGYTGDKFRVGKASRAEGLLPCPPGEIFKVEKGGVYLEVLRGKPSLRRSEAELTGHPAWWGLPAGHAPLRGLLGARLEDALGQPCGLIMVSDKEGGGDFTEDDEAHLRQLASVTSLALGHIEARIAAEAATVAKSQFLANMSHELRTPMNAILGMIKLALPRTTEPMAQECLQTAKGSADLLLTLLNDLLDSAKIESGKLELESAPFSLRRVLDQTTRVLSVRASEKGISFSCRIPPEVPDTLVGDQVRLRQILFNLAGNGIKFTDKGEVAISARVESQAAEEACLEFAVRDTGIGILRADIERIFQPFAQAEVSTTRRFGGTGLGLTICSSLVAMMGGRIWAESEPGHGSTFYFTVRLPLAEELPPEPATPDVPTAATSKLRILLAEDNLANQKLVTCILKERGHAIDVASGGQHAIRMAQENRYDVILMDVQMPGMDGTEATKVIRAREVGQQRIPIVAMTAHAMKGDREQCLAAGMDAYLSKPIDAQEMISLVETLGAPPQSADAAAPAAQEAAKNLASTVFDPELALKRCLNRPGMLEEMIEGFFADTDSLLPQMRAALDKGDLQEMGHLGHRLKGTVVYLGAQPAEAAALRVERFCKSGRGTRSEAELAVAALERECEALMAALREHLPAVASKKGDEPTDEQAAHRPERSNPASGRSET